MNVAWEVEIDAMRCIVFAATKAKAKYIAFKAWREAGYGVNRGCPLQLEVIRRAIILWSNQNDVVLSPFAGIGSEGYEAIKCGREFVGIELKQSYYNQAVENLKAAVVQHRSEDLFSRVAAS